MTDVQHAIWQTGNDLVVTACGQKWDRQGTIPWKLGADDKATCEDCIATLRAAMIEVGQR